MRVSLTTLRRVEALERRRSIQRVIGGWPAIEDDLDAWEATAMRQQDSLRRSDEPACAPPVVMLALDGGGALDEEVRRQLRHRLKN